MRPETARRRSSRRLRPVRRSCTQNADQPAYAVAEAGQACDERGVAPALARPRLSGARQQPRRRAPPDGARRPRTHHEHSRCRRGARPARERAIPRRRATVEDAWRRSMLTQCHPLAPAARADTAPKNASPSRGAVGGRHLTRRRPRSAGATPASAPASTSAANSSPSVAKRRDRRSGTSAVRSVACRDPRRPRLLLGGGRRGDSPGDGGPRLARARLPAGR